MSQFYRATRPESEQPGSAPAELRQATGYTPMARPDGRYRHGVGAVGRLTSGSASQPPVGRASLAPDGPLLCFREIGANVFVLLSPDMRDRRLFNIVTRRVDRRER
jgi:hypothetical protein